MKISLSGISDSGAVDVSDDVFGSDFRPALVHQVVTAMLSGARSGSKKNKSRSDVAGGGAKPWKQKGTGHARAGTRSSPIFRGGGVTFAARPRDCSQKVNRKMYRKALVSVLSQFHSEGRIRVVKELSVGEAKTSAMIKMLSDLGVGKCLLVDDSPSSSLILSTRNIPHVSVVDVEGVSPLLLVQSNEVVFTADAIAKLNERLAT